MTPEQRYRRLLRWYPRSWRELNEHVVLGTMLDEADRDGRTAPSAAERLSAIGHGLGLRLDARLAVVAAVAALVVAAAAGAITVWATVPLSAAGAWWVLPALTVTLGPALAVVGWISLARQRGLVSDPLALVLAVISAPTLVAAGLAQVSWAAAFRAANEGVPPTGVAGAWTWYFVAAWALGAVTITLFINAQLRQARMSWLGSATLAGIIGAVLAPVIGLSLISPYMTGIAAAGLALCSALQARPRRNRRGDPSSIEPPGAPVAARTRNLVRSLAILSATVSTIGVFYALTGSRWGLPTDATEAMAHGIAVALLAALPLLASAGTLIDARSHVHRLHTWGPLLLIALAVGAVAVAYQGGPAWNRMVGGFAGASALVGAAIAWWLSSRLRGRARITIAVLLGVVFASFLGIVVMPILAFLVPVLSVVFALWGPRRTSTDQVPRSRTAPTVSTT